MWKFLSSLLADKVFDFALGVSLFLHLLILVKLPQLRPHSHNLPKFIYRFEEKKELLSVVKYTAEADTKAKGRLLTPQQVYKKFSQRINDQAPATGKSKFSPDIREKMKKVDLLSPEQVDEELFKKMIEVQKVPADPKVKAFYLRYYDTIRAKIKEMAYKNYRKGLPGGDVFIRFTLHRSGKLISAEVVKEKSSATYRLCQIAMRSLQQAAPFNPFPDALIHEKLRFNVIISFKRR